MSAIQLPSTQARRGNTRAARALRAAAALSVALLLGSCNDDPVGPSHGSLIVNVTGLPEGATADVSLYSEGCPPGLICQDIARPGPFATFERTDTADALIPHDYVLIADTVEVDGELWAPAPLTQAVTIEASNTPATATVSYGIGTTQLTVNITGLPDGAQPIVTVTGPGDFRRTLTASETFTAILGGAYTITASPVTTDNGASWRSPAPATHTVTVRVGESAVAEVAYSTFGLGLEPVVSGLLHPVHLTAPPGDARLFIVTQPGQIRIVKNGSLLATPFLDIGPHVRCCGEEGLLNMVFDPNYATTGYFWVYFTDVNGNIAIRRYHASPTSDVADTDSLPVLNIPHPNFYNHNGGLMMFGTDGLLYISTGDGGGAGDTYLNGQNLNSLLGKLLRIDVRTAPYVVPPNNPFVGQTGRRGEIWAYGLRNPWRFDLHPVPGAAGVMDVYIADVGQALFEEINIAFNNPPGINYGWNVMEGLECYEATTCDRTGKHLPSVVYDHSRGCSITGGYVYRGTQMPELAGEFFYSDFCQGWISSAKVTTPPQVRTREWFTASVGNVTSFGEDGVGELYVIEAAGAVLKLVRR